MQLLGPAAEHPGLSWQFAPNRVEAWCRTVEPAVSRAFRQRWLRQLKCQHGVLGIDGNAKTRTKLCANTDDGVWDCPLLRAHCLTGCQNSPVPGKRYCGLHLSDVGPVFGSDDFWMSVLPYLVSGPVRQTNVTTKVTYGALCRRVRRVLAFAFQHAR